MADVVNNKVSNWNVRDYRWINALYS
jgi:hypothetical protein